MAIKRVDRAIINYGIKLNELNLSRSRAGERKWEGIWILIAFYNCLWEWERAGMDNRISHKSTSDVGLEVFPTKLSPRPKTNNSHY
jgi:hypothetical protein